MDEKKTNFYKIIYIILIVMGIIALILPWIILHKSDSSNGEIVSLISIASYFRFFTGSKSQMIVDIAMHNVAIAVFGFVISFFSRGVLGCLALFLNLFVIGMVLCDIHTLPTILFAFLEFLGICVAVFGGTILSEKRIKFDVPLNKIFKSALVLILVIAVLYFVAAFIESNILLNKWS